MPAPKTVQSRPSRKTHRTDLTNPADYKEVSHRVVRLESPGLDPISAEVPFPDRDEPSPANRFKGDNGAGSPLSVI
jgi:hypothetical protein